MGRSLALALLLALASAGSSAETLGSATLDPCEGSVERVVVRSDTPIRDPGRLLDAARIEVGAPLGPDDLQRSLRALRATGLAGAVEARCVRRGGGVEVEYTLRGAIYVTSVRLEGELGLDRRDLEPAVPQKADEPLIDDRVIRGVYRIQDRLADSGYLDARVRIDVDLDEAAKQAQVVYEIDAGEAARVGEVRFGGDLDPVLVGGLLDRSRLGTGERFRRTAVRTEPERLEGWLRERGYLRAVVDEPTESYDATTRQVALFYPVDLGPFVEVVVEGAERKKLQRKGLLPYLDGVGYDDALVAQSRAAITRYFQGKGYYDVRVGSEEEVGEDRIRLVVRVDVGARSTVEEVEIVGNVSIPTAQLTPRIETAPKTLLARGSGRLVDETLEADVENLQSFYALSGFPDAQVGPAEVARAGSGISVEIPVLEGERQRVVEIGFAGVAELSADDLLREIFLRRGGPFHPLLLDESVNAIRAAYQEQGFASVVVEAELDWNPEESLVDVLFRVVEGPRTFVEGIVLRGNRHTDPELIRRAMRLETGAPVSARSLLEVQRRLYGLGIFSRVRVDTVPGTPYASGRDVLVSLEEGKRSKLTYGVGYDSEDGVRGLFGYTRSNLFGKGISARFDLQASEADRQVRLLVRQPYVGLKEIPVRYSLFRVEEEQDSFDSRRQGLQVEASRRLGHSLWSLLYTFKIVDTELKPPLVDLDRELASVEISSLTPTLFVDRRDDPVNPRRGSTSTVQLEYAFPFLTADSHEFAKLFTQRTAYLPLDRFGTLAASVRFGGIEPIGDENLVDPTVPDSVASRFVPISERFFGGGPSTHRAFRLDRLAIEGESALDGAEFGGNGLLLFNLDYRFPIAGALEGTVFFDSGNIWGDWRDIEIDEMRHGAGVGVRYLSPIGPLRVEVGWKLDREPGESPREIFISFGHPF